MTGEERSAARRRLRWRHLVTVPVVVTVVVVLTGVLARNGTAGPRPGRGTPTASAGRPAASAGTTPSSAPALTADDLLPRTDLRRLGPGPWRVAGTDTAPPGAGPGSACRQGRVADPAALSALVRTFRSASRPARVAQQSVEVSSSPRRAVAAYRATLGWFAGCRAARIQLLDAHPVDGVGDRAEVLTLRWWRRPATTLGVAVARVGAVTTSTVTAVSAAGGPRPRPAAQALALAGSVARLCPVAGAPRCPHHPVLREGPLPSDGSGSRLLAAVDLPPVGAVDRPWVGTRPVAVHVDRPTTSCDRVGLVSAGARSGQTRTFLVPGAGLPPRFGLTETYGGFPTGRAAARFVTALRASVTGCEKRDPATRVGPERRLPDRSAAVDGSAWDLSTSLSATRTVRFRLGVVRVGRRVARLTFTPATGGDLSTAAFDALLRRAGERLG